MSAGSPRSSGRRVGKYTLEKKLGQGQFGKVYKAVSDKGEQVAVKCIVKQDMAKVENGEMLMYREVGTMVRLFGHPNVISIIAVMQTTSKYYVVIELAEGGDLFDVIVPDEGVRGGESEARQWFQQLICAVYFCHSNEIAHRDIKPENLLLQRNGDSFILKLTDFGLSNHQQTNEEGDVSRTLHLKTVCGTPDYVAPEVFSQTQSGYNGFAADLWSCGVVLYHMLEGRLPFRGNGVKSMLRKITSADPEPPTRASSEAWNLLQQLLVKDPQERMTLDKLVAHDWFRVGFDSSLLIRETGREPPDALRFPTAGAGAGG